MNTLEGVTLLSNSVLFGWRECDILGRGRKRVYSNCVRKRQNLEHPPNRIRSSVGLEPRISRTKRREQRQSKRPDSPKCDPIAQSIHRRSRLRILIGQLVREEVERGRAEESVDVEMGKVEEESGGAECVQQGEVARREGGRERTEEGEEEHVHAHG